MEIKKFVVGMNETNCYIIYDKNTLEALIIDPGDEEKVLIQYIDKHALKLQGILLTHYHYDHIGGVEGLKRKYGCPIYAHKKEAEGLQKPEMNRSSIGGRTAVSIKPDKTLIDGDMISIGTIILQVIHTPGHTPGGICLKIKDSSIIFTGDTIFSDDLGRTDLEGGSEESLKKSIVNKVSKWSDDTMIYPGHGEAALMLEVKGRGVQYLN
ncbi:MBL fold metallo-hydrolase [Clostridium formicaceticum]|uniref:MBL fold metallo-hydrolase n=1 Tax=Clostridium formicaceticum TaxID=1497 RepID=A0AAC9WEY6_9CLOT|nr:MBL fold metallo-hydrolase [Clostridium formicaceticum]AOY75800.1 MBL fold metallo-hydrolase [Clostridium formicaceticum]ARE86129.1 putative polyketide biosynthesis zinc-dependent hydrolase PksB [Clostridium formicaceticum]